MDVMCYKQRKKKTKSKQIRSTTSHTKRNKNTVMKPLLNPPNIGSVTVNPLAMKFEDAAASNTATTSNTNAILPSLNALNLPQLNLSQTGNQIDDNRMNKKTGNNDNNETRMVGMNRYDANNMLIQIPGPNSQTATVTVIVIVTVTIATFPMIIMEIHCTNLSKNYCNNQFQLTVR